MAIYTTLFICDPRLMVAGFPGWRLPLPKPVTREFKNPFTGQMVTVETREPDWPEDEIAESMDRENQVVAIDGNYENYLEGRHPALVQRHPHWTSKGLTEVQLGPLARAVGVKEKLECPLYSPPSSNAVLQELPRELAPKLVSLDENGLKALAVKWAAEMSTPGHTHSVTGVKLNDGWSQSDAMEIIRPIVALARKASDGQRMYLLIQD